MSRGSIVGTGSDYMLDDRSAGVRVPGRVKNFCFSISSTPALGPTQSPTQWVPRDLSPRVKRQGPETDHSPPNSAEVKNGSVHPLPPYVLMSWC
jgi:hypothetical protein